MNTQGIKIFIKAQASADYLQIGCMKSLGDLDLGKRSSKDDGCMDKEVMGKIIGSLKYGNLQVGHDFKNTDTLATAQLKVAHESSPAELQDFRIELPDAITPTTGNGTQFDFPVYITERSISFPVDDEMQSSFTAEMDGKPVVNPAT